MRHLAYHAEHAFDVRIAEARVSRKLERLSWLFSGRTVQRKFFEQRHRRTHVDVRSFEVNSTTNSAAPGPLGIGNVDAVLIVNMLCAVDDFRCKDGTGIS